MLRIRKILFPTDFSPSAGAALPHALFLAHRYGAELHMLHVLVPYDEPSDDASRFPDQAQIAEHLHAFAAGQSGAAPAARATDDLVIRQVERREFSAAMAIVAYTEEEGIDLIVMGTHGRRGVRHLLAGSVTEEVVRMAPCAVLSVRARQESHAAPAAIRKVLAPTDFSDDAREAVAVARELANSYGAGLQVLHVWENVMHPAFYNMGAASIKDLQPDIEERTMQALREFASPGEGTAVEYAAVEGHAAREIVAFAEANASDLIVIATHGLTGLDHFLMGSVTEKVVRRAPCPVLVVKRKQALGAG